MAETSALVVIDVQQGLIEGFEADWQEVLPAINQLIARARPTEVPVVFVQHSPPGADHPLHRNRPGWALQAGLDVRPEDFRIEKGWSDAFCETDLDALLRAAAISRLFVVGAQTEYCVDTTARRAVSLGYHVELVADGHTTSSNGLLSREQIIAHHNQTLANLATNGVRPYGGKAGRLQKLGRHSRA
jgi:nicotinamidase-related amidase